MFAYEFEIKTSKADFKNEYKKRKYHYYKESDKNKYKSIPYFLEKMPNYLYYIVPKDLITPDDVKKLYPFAGLIYVENFLYKDFTTNIWFPHYTYKVIKKARKIHHFKCHDTVKRSITINLFYKWYKCFTGKKFKTLEYSE